MICGTDDTCAKSECNRTESYDFKTKVAQFKTNGPSPPLSFVTDWIICIGQILNRPLWKYNHQDGDLRYDLHFL